MFEFLISLLVLLLVFAIVALIIQHLVPLVFGPLSPGVTTIAYVIMAVIFLVFLIGLLTGHVPRSSCRDEGRASVQWRQGQPRACVVHAGAVGPHRHHLHGCR